MTMKSTMDFTILLFLGFLFFSSFQHSHGDYSTCLMIYNEGGAPAVLQSPNCSHWSHSTEAIVRSKGNCESANIQGRREYQEDRVLCALDIPIPFPGRTGNKEVVVGMVAVFDGHGGAEASEVASKLLPKYFSLHTHFLIDGIYSSSSGEERDQHDLNIGSSKWMMPEIFGESHHFKILKESLLRTIDDIDETFSKEAISKNLNSGSTATIVAIVDGQILAANVGDSKALLCSEKSQSSQELKEEMYNPSNGSRHFFAKELTRDHHPDRDDERSRVEAAGGYVSQWGGVPRVNGQLAVSRAIGDLSFKRYGVISAAEVTDWQPLTVNDHYLVVTSDGIFEELVTQDVCDLIWEARREGNEKSKLHSSCQYSLADCIVNTAFESGSMDNLSAIVISLRSISSSGSSSECRCDEEGNTGSFGFGCNFS